jgi:hypothetical protein
MADKRSQRERRPDEARERMICPKCGAEYRPGFTLCSDCLVDLAEKPAPEESGRREPVTVFSSGDAGRVMLAKALLESAGIPFAASGNTRRAATLADLAGRPVELQVSRQDAEGAFELLSDLDAYAQEPEGASDDPGNS